MKRKITSKKIMAVLMAASLTLTPAEMAAASEMPAEEFLSEDNNETVEESMNEAEMDQEEVVESQNSEQFPEADVSAEIRQEMPETIKEGEGTSEMSEPDFQEGDEEFGDGTDSSAETSAEYSDGKITWTLDTDGTLTIDGNGVELTEQDEDSKKLEEVGITQGKVKKIVIGNGIIRLSADCLKTFKYWISELEIKRASIGADYYYSAFSSCGNLEKVTIGEGVEEISDNAFRECKKLSQVQINGTGIKRIGKNAFSGCENLKEITLPESVKNIGGYAFFSSGLEKIQIKGMVETEESAFTNCKNLKSFPFDHISKIGNGTFYSCGLEGSITLPENVESLGEYAFHHCESLEEVVIQNCVVDGESFAGCTNLKSLIINGGEISGAIYAERLILGCNVKKVGILSGNTMKYMEINGPSEMQFDKDFAHSAFGLESVVISGQLNLPSDAFSGLNNLKQAVMKNGVSVLEKDMFYNCKNLESVSFEDVSLKTISSGTFKNCENLKNITLPETVTKIDTYAFENCKNLEQMQIPSKTEIIGRSAFNGCTSLQKISIPSSVKTIESWAFAETGLKEVILHDGLETIKSSAFRSCLSLKKIRIPKTVSKLENQALGIMDEGNKMKVIPGGFTVEGYTNSAAEKYVKRMTGGPDFEGLKFVSIGKLNSTVTNINKTKISALKTRNFTGKPLTQTITVTAGSKKLVNGKDYTLTWKNNTNIGTASVTIKGKGDYNGSVTKTFRIVVQKNAAYTVSKLKYKITNADISGRGTVSFTGVTDKTTRKTLIIPSTVKIGGKSFWVTAIGTSAMSGARNLTTVKIGANVATIGAKTFYGCGKLASVTISSTRLTAAKTGTNAFKGIRSNCKFKVPASKVTAYKKLFMSKGAGKKIKVTK